MKNNISSVNSSYLNIFQADTGKNRCPVTMQGDSKSSEKRITEVPNAVSNSIVKVPISYVKTGEKDFPYGLKAHFYKLSNGQKVVILPKEGKTVLRSYVNTGSLNEPDNVRGISHYIEHNLFNGSEGLEAGEFFKTAENIGADTNASTGLAETNYYIASNLLNEGDLEHEIKIHASMLETPKFAVNMLEKEKGIVNSEINMITSNPDNIAYNTTLKNLYNIKTTSPDVIAGTTDNITNLTRDDVVKYFNDNYYPANMVTVITGEVEPEETMKLVAKYFNSTKQPNNNRHFENLKPIEKTVRQDIISDKTDSPHIVMGFAGPKNSDLKDRIYTMALQSLMFTSSSAQKVFEPLNTNIETNQEKITAKPDGSRGIMIAANINEDKCEKLISTIYSQIEKPQKFLLCDEELATLKRNMKKDFANIFESSFAINEIIGTSILEGYSQNINDWEEIIDNMTAQDLQNTAKKYFNLNKVSLTVLHPANSSEELIKANYAKTNNVSFTGTIKKQAVNMDEVKQYNLPNNFRTATYNSRFPDVHANIVYKTKEPIIAKNPAAYSVLNEMILDGTTTKSREELTKLAEKYGMELIIHADKMGILAMLTVDKDDYNKAQEILLDAIKNPDFSEKKFQKAVTNVKDSLQRSGKNPANKLNPELFKDEYTKEECLEGLNTLTLQEIKDLYNTLLKTSCAAAVIAAPFENNPKLKSDVFRTINSFDKVEPYQYNIKEDYIPFEKTKVLTDTDNKSQARILMAYKFRMTGNMKDKATVKLLNYILGGGPSSRLFSDLREKQKLAYSVHSGSRKENSTGAIVLSISTTTDNNMTGEKSYENLQKSIEGFKNNIEKIKTEKVSEEELNKAKLAIKNSILSENEKTINKNISLTGGLSNPYGLNAENMLLEELDKITVDDIYNAAQNIFSGKPIYSIVATKDTLDYNKDYLDTLENT